MRINYDTAARPKKEEVVVDLGDSGFDLRRDGATSGVLVLIKRDGMIQVEIQILHP